MNSPFWVTSPRPLALRAFSTKLRATDIRALSLSPLLCTSRRYVTASHASCCRTGHGMLDGIRADGAVSLQRLLGLSSISMRLDRKCPRTSPRLQRSYASNGRDDSFHFARLFLAVTFICFHLTCLRFRVRTANIIAPTGGTVQRFSRASGPAPSTAGPRVNASRSPRGSHGNDSGIVSNTGDKI
jgi:hypothetical protein